MGNQPPTILVVDDDQGLRRLIEKTLRRAGFTAAGASSGSEAIAWLEEHEVDLMLLDLGLPDLPGAELIGRLAALNRTVPFIVITGQGDERVAVEMMKRGAADYLVKDQQFLEFVPAVVNRAIAQMENQRRLIAAEQALQREHAFISAVLDTTGTLVVVLDREGRIVRFNRACEVTTGFAFAEVEGQSVWNIFLADEEKEAVLKVFYELRAGHFPNQYENHWLTKSGGRRLIAWSNTALLDASGTVEYIVCSGTDITERKRLEKEILEISEREQRRIGQDLHDGLCQHLAGIELMSQVLEQNLALKSKSDAARAGEIAKHVREAISQTRLLARGLSPVMLESEGLMSALRELAANTERMFGLACKVRFDSPVELEDHIAATHLYRIAQEAVSNAIKHGKAKHIVISLRAVEGRITLKVKDDGLGLPQDAEKKGGMGLRIMRYRSGMIGGALEIQPNSGRGTSVVCSVRAHDLAMASGPDFACEK